MSSLFDDVMMGARVAGAFFKGAKQVGKMASDGIQKVNGSETFQNLKKDVQQKISQYTSGQPTVAKKFCHQCGTAVDMSAKFCCNCGTSLEIEAADPEDCEVPSVVLQNDENAEIPDIFDFQPENSKLKY